MIDSCDPMIHGDGDSALVDSEADRAALLELEEVASRHLGHPLLGDLGSVRHVLATRG